jgi:hypothetical protein|tara:strand:+ start:195 stop:419 length:225 start_codon:yes stop_codon:yes gene_type:complete
MTLSNAVCENCHKGTKRQFKIIEPGVTYRMNGTDTEDERIGTFCTAACAKSYAAWMYAGGLSKMPKGWKVEEIK